MLSSAIATQLLAAAATPALAQPPAATEDTHAVAALPWAKPLQGGPIRVAAVFPRDGSADLAALESAFDLRIAPFPFGPERPTANEALAQALKEKADALLISALPLADLGEATRAALSARISAGAGLLWIAHSTGGTPELEDFLTQANLTTLDPAPDFAARAGSAALSGLQPGLDQAFAYSGEKSRAVELRFWKPRPQGHALIPLAPLDALNAPTTYENYIALTGDALRWAARRDPEVAIQAIEDRSSGGPRAEETPPQLPASFVKRMKEAALPGVLRPFALRLDRPAPRNYSLRVQARYSGRPIRWSYIAEERLPKGAQETQFNIPIGAGPCFLDLWIMDGAKIVDWYTQPLDLPAAPELGEFSVGPTALNANDRLRISIEVHKDLLRGDTRRLQPTTVFLRITDALGRVVATRDVPVAGGGALVTEELALVDLTSPYARAELFAAPVLDTPLSWWIREHAAHRAAHLTVRLPLPEGLALILDEPGEGSFAGSTRRRQWTAAGVEFIYPGEEPDLGNLAADGMRLVARLGPQSAFPGDRLDARSRSGIALRRSAARYAPARPALYTVDAAPASSAADSETARAAIERVVRETDPKAAVALLDGDFSAAGTGGFLVLPADPSVLESTPLSSASFLALRAPLPRAARAQEFCRWLPWLAAAYQANALWISRPERDASETALPDLLPEAARVREGFDVLLRRATPTPLTDDTALSAPDTFQGLVRRFTLDSATLYLMLADPTADSTSSIKITAPDEGTRIYTPTSPAAKPSRAAAFKLRPGGVAMAVLLPYDVTRIALEVPTSAHAGRRLTIRASVKTRGELPGDHVLRITCFGPLGDALPHYSRTVFAAAGAGATWLPLAFNDAPGAYRIVARDVLSGVQADAEVIVVAP